MKIYKIRVALWIGCVAILLSACGVTPSSTATAPSSLENAISDCLSGTGYENAKLVNWAKINNFLSDFDGQTVVLIGKFGGQLRKNFDGKHAVSYTDRNNQYFVPFGFELDDTIARDWVRYTNGTQDEYYGIVACQVFAKKPNQTCNFNRICGMNLGNKITFKSSIGRWSFLGHSTK